MTDLLGPLLRGTVLTIELTVLASLVAMAIGLTVGLARLSPFAPLRILAICYIELFRGTSLLVQLFWWFFVLPHFGIFLDPFVVGVVGIGMNIGAYGAEVVRGAIQAVPRGQWEAAIALNLSRFRTYRDIILPQAIPPIVPALGNYLIGMFKETPLLSAIAIIELMARAKLIGSDTFRYMEPITLVGVFFLVMSLAASGLIRLVERRLRERG